MILVCPSCESKFKVPDNAIPPEGRKVRCAQCGNAWHATKAHELKPAARKPVASKPSAAPESYTPPAAEVDAGTAAQAAAIRRSVVDTDDAAPAVRPPENLFDEGIGNTAPVPTDDEPAVESDNDFNIEIPDDDFGDDADSSLDDDFGLEVDDDEDIDEDDILARRRGDLRRVAARKSLAIKRKLLAVGWGALLIFILGILGALFFMKETVTQAFPGTNQLYDFFASSQAEALYKPETDKPLSKPITETEVYVTAGLIRDRMRIETVSGQSQVVIVGELKNTGQRAANVPKVEISIKDGRGRVLDQWVYDPPGLVLRRLSTLAFETSRPVPAGMNTVEVRPLEGTRSNNEAPSQL